MFRAFLPAALLGAAALGLASPAWAAKPAIAHIVVRGHSQDLSYSCGHGDTVLVESRSDYLTFTGTCSTLTITSHSNYIKLNRVSSVILSGSTVSDEVCWDSGSPKVHNSGKANVYGKCK
jgi:hypothetical protein